jgi:hypothetical protein
MGKWSHLTKKAKPSRAQRRRAKQDYHWYMTRLKAARSKFEKTVIRQMLRVALEKGDVKLPDNVEVKVIWPQVDSDKSELQGPNLPSHSEE